MLYFKDKFLNRICFVSMFNDEGRVLPGVLILSQEVYHCKSKSCDHKIIVDAAYIRRRTVTNVWRTCDQTPLLTCLCKYGNKICLN